MYGADVDNITLTITITDPLAGVIHSTVEEASYEELTAAQDLIAAQITKLDTYAAAQN